MCPECGRPMFDGERGYCDGCRDRRDVELAERQLIDLPSIRGEEVDRRTHDRPRGY